MHHRMGSYYESSNSSCPSPIPSMSDGGPAFSVSSEPSPNNNLFHTTKSNGGPVFHNQGNLLQYKPVTLRTSTSPVPPKIQPRKGILMSPSFPSQMTPPPPPPTSSIPKKTGNLKNATIIVGGCAGTSPTRQQVMNRDQQYYSTQPRPSSSLTREPPLLLARPQRHFSPPLPPLNHALVRGRKVTNSREKTSNNQKRLKFECDDMRQIHALNKRLASLTIADMSPKLALQRILLLYKRGDHRYANNYNFCSKS